MGAECARTDAVVDVAGEGSAKVGWTECDEPATLSLHGPLDRATHPNYARAAVQLDRTGAFADCLRRLLDVAMAVPRIGLGNEGVSASVAGSRCLAV